MLTSMSSPNHPWSTYVAIQLLSMASPSKDLFDSPVPKNCSTGGRGAAMTSVHTSVRPVSSAGLAGRLAARQPGDDLRREEQRPRHDADERGHRHPPNPGVTEEEAGRGDGRCRSGPRGAPSGCGCRRGRRWTTSHGDQSVTAGDHPTHPEDDGGAEEHSGVVGHLGGRDGPQGAREAALEGEGLARRESPRRRPRWRGRPTGDSRCARSRARSRRPHHGVSSHRTATKPRRRKPAVHGTDDELVVQAHDERR